jgi:hypothetical protein
MKFLKTYWWVFGLLLALLVTLFSPLASSHPDGLERVAEDKGFLDKAREAYYHIIPDYVFPGIENEKTATIVAGIVGTLLVFGLAYGLAWLLRRRAQLTAPQAQQPNAKP